MSSSSSLVSDATSTDLQSTLITHHDQFNYLISADGVSIKKSRRSSSHDRGLWRSFLDLLVILSLLGVIGLGYVTVEQRRVAEKQRHELAVLRTAVAKLLLRHQGGGDLSDITVGLMSNPTEVNKLAEETIIVDLNAAAGAVQHETTHLHRTFGGLNNEPSNRSGRSRRASEGKRGKRGADKLKNGCPPNRVACTMPFPPPVFSDGLNGTVFHLRPTPEIVYTGINTTREGWLRGLKQRFKFGSASVAVPDGLTAATKDSIKIEQTGHYMVIAQVTFFHTLGSNSYDIAVIRNKKSDAIEVVTTCSTSGSTSIQDWKRVQNATDTTKCRTHKFFVPQDSCHTSAVVRLEKGDKVAIRIVDHNKCLSVKRGATHMSLIRLAN